MAQQDQVAVDQNTATPDQFDWANAQPIARAASHTPQPTAAPASDSFDWANAQPIDVAPHTVTPPGQNNPQMTPDQQAAYARMQHAPIVPGPKPNYIQSREQAMQDQATGVAKGAAETVHTVGSFLHNHLGVPMPEEVLRPELAGGTESKNENEMVGKFAENIGELFLGSEAAKGLALPEKLGITQKIVDLAKTSPTAAKIWSMGLHALETFGGVTGQQLLHGNTLPQAATTGGEAAAGGAVLEGVTAGAGPAYRAVKNVLTGDEEMPSVTQQVLKGEGVVQPKAEEALRKTSPTSTWNQSLRTTLEDPIKDANATYKASYKAIDDASETDLKALRDRQADIEYKLTLIDPDNATDADIAKSEKLTEQHKAVGNQIEAAKQKAIDKGVSPSTIDTADAQFTRAKALQELETKLFKNPNIIPGNAAKGTSETVNVDQAVKVLQRLQDSQRYGAPRLEQALGKDGASKLLDEMYKVQRQGKKALESQDFAKMVGKYVGRALEVGAVATAGYEVMKPNTSGVPR